jgi:hypothetical protein
VLTAHSDSESPTAQLIATFKLRTYFHLLRAAAAITMTYRPRDVGAQAIENETFDGFSTTDLRPEGLGSR